MPDRSRLHVPAIDGLRAIAVVAVFLYHVDPAHLPGGFLGVDLFFVISGYLITLGLLEEWGTDGRIGLHAFWMRRVRRLAPAAGALLMIVLFGTLLFAPEHLASLRGEALAALVYATNWYLVIRQQPYFEAVAAPSMLRHLWSLAVEEQFYVLWPPLLLLALRAFRPRLVLLTVVLAAAASVLLLALLYALGASHDRLYYGTDTRAATLLIGAALAFVCRPSATAARTDRYELEVFGLGCFGLLIASFFALGDSRPLYQGGLPLVAVASAGTLMMVVRADFALTRYLALPPLRWLGVRSYSVYLWHWPVVVLLSYGAHLPVEGLAVIAIEAVITLALAEASYRFVETPFRTGQAQRRLVAVWASIRGRRTVFASAAVACAAALTLVTISTATARAPEPPSYLSVPRVSGVLVAASTATVDSPVKLTGVPAIVPVHASVETAVQTPEPAATVDPFPPSPLSVIATSPSPEADPVPPLPSGPLEGDYVTAIGDSVMLGSAQALANALGVVDIDAHAGRSAGEALAVIRERAAEGRLGPTVVLHIGNNGVLLGSDLESIVQLLEPAHRIVLVNLHVPRPWESANNGLLAALVRTHPEIRLVDWHAASAGHDEYLYADQIHLQPAGAAIYASLIAAAVAN